MNEITQFVHKKFEQHCKECPECLIHGPTLLCLEGRQLLLKFSDLMHVAAFGTNKWITSEQKENLKMAHVFTERRLQIVK